MNRISDFEIGKTYLVKRRDYVHCFKPGTIVRVEGFENGMINVLGSYSFTEGPKPIYQWVTPRDLKREKRSWIRHIFRVLIGKIMTQNKIVNK